MSDGDVWIPRTDIDSLSQTDTLKIERPKQLALEITSDTEDEILNRPLGSPISSTGTAKFDRYGFSGGIQYTLQQRMRSEKTMKREKKWLDMISDKNWEKYQTKERAKLVKRCRKGIPDSVRAKAWFRLCGAQAEMKRNDYKTYETFAAQEIDSRIHTEIENDLHRSFPNHEMFVEHGGTGQKQLYALMRAYTVYDPVVGFCQGQVPIACVLLMHMPAEHAFWSLVMILDKYLTGYYSHGMEQLKDDGAILMLLVKRVYPELYHAMCKSGIDGPLFMLEWFMCVFSRDLPWLTVLRVWDMFLCEGVKVIFKVALVVMRNSVAPNRIPDDMYDLLNCLKISRMPRKFLEPDFIVAEVLKLPIHDSHIRRARKTLKKRKLKQEKKRLKQQQLKHNAS